MSDRRPVGPGPHEWHRAGRQRRAFLATVGMSLASVASARGDGVMTGGPGAASRHADSLPPYEARERVTGTICLWGHGSYKRDFLGNLARAWERGFRRVQPGVRFEYRLYGTASAMGALYTGAGNLAILGEEIHPDAARAFVRAKGYPPTGFQIATGSLDRNYFDYAHMVFVHRDNRLERLSLRQLEGIFGTEHRRGRSNLRTWDQLGLTGEWQGRRIQPYCWRLDEDFALFLREAVLQGSHRWNADIREFVQITRPDGSSYDRGQQILDALARDRYGIAISNVRFTNRHVKAVALARRDDGPYYEATEANLIAQRYPLTRIIPAFLDRPPGERTDPKLREYLRYVLSREGQQALLRQSGYLPLGGEAIREQLQRLA